MVSDSERTGFKDYYKMLFPYAYNFLRIYEDAQDAVQEVLLKYFLHKREDIDNIKGYLVKSVINQSVEIKNKRKRFIYQDILVFEPIASEEADADINLRDSACYSLLILLKKLNARERAVFILKEGFGYSHQEIADLLSCTVEQSRQLLSRGKSRLTAEPGLKAARNNPVGEGILDKFIKAIRQRDIKMLENLLFDDINLYAEDKRHKHYEN